MSDTAVVDWADWLATMRQPSVLIELGTLLLCALVAWQLTRLIAKAFEERELNSIMFGRRIVDGVLFPALLLCLAYAARKVLSQSIHLGLFKLAIPVLISLLVIRLGVKVLQAAFGDTPVVKLLERSISWVAWAAMVLWVSGLLPLVMEELDLISWKVGNSTLSVRKIIEGTLTAGLVLIITLWISSALEAKLLRQTLQGLDGIE